MTRDRFWASRAVASRIAEQMAHDCFRWEAWASVPPSLWPDHSIRDFVCGTGFEGMLDWHEPTGAELQAIVFATTAASFPRTSRSRRPFIESAA
jgi:hypothetical protein